MFTSKNIVRMHDTDMAGILYFPRLFRFVHDAMEDWMEKEGLSFQYLFTKEDFAFVIVHAEADYKSFLTVGDKLEVHLYVEKMGTSSFTISYSIYKNQEDLVGTAKTVHVCIDRPTRTKIPIPVNLREKLEKYLK